MGSAEDPTPKAPQPTTSVQEPAVSLPTTATDWATAVQAYYSAASPAFFSPPPVWGPQHMGMPYGTPIPYAPMYGHHPVYVHPSAIPPVMYPIAKSKSGEEGGKVTSGSADDYGLQSGQGSGSGSGSEGTSGSRDDSTDQQEISKKRSLGVAFIDGENSHPIAGAQNNGTSAESSCSVRARTASKLPVSAPGRATLPGSPTNLNIGMDCWNASHVGSVAVTGGPNVIPSASVAANGVMLEHLRKDELELKREKRKQYNREAARRSRVRKQEESEELARKVNELYSENSVLKIELQRLHEVCKGLEKEKALIKEVLDHVFKANILELKASTVTPSVKHLR